MNKLMTISVTFLLFGIVSADLMAQRGGRGQGQPGSQNNQSVQKTRAGRSSATNSTGQNGQLQKGGNRAGRGQNQSGRSGPGQYRVGQGGSARGQSSGTLTAQESNELTLMREEEKLARDVYVALNQKWGATIFANISRAESKHMQAVAGLLNRYQIPDPVASNSPGAFTQPRFQQLYQSLVNEGSASLSDALKVGLKIEEMDIADLRNAIQSTSNNDIKQVFQHLEQGSRNHLRAFASQLRNTGGTYTSTQLSQLEFDAIANSTPGRGGNQGQKGNQAQGQRGQTRRNGQAQPGHGRAQGSGNNQGNGQGKKGRGR